MQQACSRCGYTSDRPARFCRQCGSQLFAETDVTSATTRNYSQQNYAQPPVQFAEQQPADYAPGFSAASYSPGTWSDQTPNTSRLYQAPQYQVPAVDQKKNFSWGKWIFLSFLTFLLLSMMAVGAFIWWGKEAVQRALRDGDTSQPVVITEPSIPGVPLPPEAPPAPQTAAVSLESLKYPDSTVVESTKAPFTEKLAFTTNDDLETVKQFYDKKFAEIFKNSATNIQTQDEEKYVYVAWSQPMITIEIEPDKKDSDKARISVVKVTAPIPKFAIPKEFQQN